MGHTEELTFRGRGAQLNPNNRFFKLQKSRDFIEGIDDWEESDEKTQFIFEYPKSIVNKVQSPDVSMLYSLNPYQGCEHGCSYCYARNSHEYWGYSAGLDFERKIIVKKDALLLFKKFLEKPGWDASVISFSGNTDCYQPAERKFKITRSLLKMAYEYKQPISIITKNALVLRDIDILSAMAKHNLCRVYFSINSLDETLRHKLEPRTSTAKGKLDAIARLSAAGISTAAMLGPVIPGLNDSEIPKILKEVAARGAAHAGYVLLRLNGQIAQIFKNWLELHFPDRAMKVWHQIQSCHNGQVNDSRFNTRMRGEGPFATLINANFKLHCKKWNLNKNPMALNSDLFCLPNAQLKLF